MHEQESLVVVMVFFPLGSVCGVFFPPCCSDHVINMLAFGQLIRTCFSVEVCLVSHLPFR